MFVEVIEVVKVKCVPRVLRCCRASVRRPLICDAGPRSLAMQPSERFSPNAMFSDSHAITRLEVSGRSSTQMNDSFL